jgi:nucleoid DNA-binding protein
MIAKDISLMTARALGADEESVNRVVDEFLERLRLMIKAGHEVELPGIGTFTTRTNAVAKYSFKTKRVERILVGRVGFEISESLKGGKRDGS